jgi:hypothetical protein
MPVMLREYNACSSSFDSAASKTEDTTDAILIPVRMASIFLACSPPKKAAIPIRGKNLFAYDDTSFTD